MTTFPTTSREIFGNLQQLEKSQRTDPTSGNWQETRLLLASHFGAVPKLSSVLDCTRLLIALLHVISSTLSQKKPDPCYLLQ